MNLPNIITTGRVLAIPFFVYFLITEKYLLALITFALASVSDFVDGYLARKMNLVTNYGKFMDPTADKLLVYSALIIFVANGLMSSVMVIIIISRDFLINTMRSIAVEKGMVVPAMWSGKIKTTIQMIGIILIIAFAQIMQGGSIVGNFEWSSIIEIVGITMTAVTIYSGIDYIVRMKDVFKSN